MSNYTELITDSYFDYAENYVSQSAADSRIMLENMPENATLADWISKIEELKKEYTCTSRYFLMKYLESREVIETEVTREYATNLPDNERDAYIRKLSYIAAGNEDDDLDNWTKLFWKAFLRYKNVSLLTREEGFKICHSLRMSYDEAEEFMVRVLENDGFNYTRSEDIIHAFCFIYHPCNSWMKAEELLTHYAEKTAGVEKVEMMAKADGFTSVMSKNLPMLLEGWETSGDDVRNAFMSWLIGRSPMLDLPSKSAFTTYNKLATFAYDICSSNSEEGNEDYIDLDSFSFEDDIRDCLESEDEPQLLSENEAVAIANVLVEYLMNSDAVISKRAQKSADEMWRYLTVDSKGRLSSTSMGQRIPELLTGKEPVTKADMLFMFYFLCNLFWVESARNDSDILFQRLDGFMALAEELLEAAMLPVLYVPHILERTLILSILIRSMKPSETKHSISVDDLEFETPMEIYKALCEYVLPRRNRQSKVSEPKNDHKAARAQLEKETAQLLANGQIDFCGLDSIFMNHVSNHGREFGKYIFKGDTITYDPNPKATIKTKADDMEIVAAIPAELSSAFESESRDNAFHIIYGLSLYLRKQFAANGITADFRVNVKATCAMSVIKWIAN